MMLYLLSEEGAHLAGHPPGPPRTLPPDQNQRDWQDVGGNNTPLDLP
jgi:hypothetical protein